MKVNTCERTHKPIALRFWVRVWHLSRLCSCSTLDVGVPRAPLVTQPWYQSPVSTKSVDVVSKSLCYPGHLAHCRSPDSLTLRNRGWA